MAILHWALKDILYEVTATGVEIKVFTFQPCHLWMRWTLTYPQEHSIPVISRGVAIHSDKRFCFVSYHNNEQSEGNDTYVHTFLKEPWPVCETRYFYFHGKMGGEKSPSTSAIFSYHRIAPPPPVETSDQAKVDLSNQGFLQYWNAASQTFSPDHNYTAVRLSLMLNQYLDTMKGPYIVKITALNGDCWQESILWSETRDHSDLPAPGVKEWLHFTLPNLSLFTAQVYRIVVHTIPGWYWWNGSEWESMESWATMQWWTSGATNPYPRGSSYYGCNFRDSSGRWTEFSNVDRTFIVWQSG